MWCCMLGCYHRFECTRCHQGKPGSNEQGAGWTNVAQISLSCSKPSNVEAKVERLTFEPGIPLTEIHQRGQKGQLCLESSAFVWAVSCHFSKTHPLRKVSSSRQTHENNILTSDKERGAQISALRTWQP